MLYMTLLFESYGDIPFDNMALLLLGKLIKFCQSNFIIDINLVSHKELFIGLEIV
ncbi:hypothetical protein Hdeb2414_s0002g00059001 [Helianthus debilis subsp. tardiflorus]